MMLRRAISGSLVATAIVLAATAPALAIVPPLTQYVGPYPTKPECQVDQQFDPDAVSPCIFRDVANPGWYYKARII